ncbi:MAG: RNA-binding protein [Lachnospiraceae bacterium]|nr:RNA-binding protein [Lachnospiraceae bacterium]MBQ2575798.1 RNA-binding protein [Lachnospiraceae bacterium]MEE3355437.1 S1-like domain-containing RNA-binding protein [Candidatus Weimeria sp.]
MFRLGEYQKLKVAKAVDFGVYLFDPEGGNGGEDAADRVLLPRKEVPEDLKVGDELKVFLYLDSDDRLIATTAAPKITLGTVASLTVRQVTKIGIFLDWGLSKDLLLPYHELVGKVEEGDEILVRMYQDKSGRLAASMRHLYDVMSTDSPYKTGDQVVGRIYEFGHDFGTFVAVDDRFSAMIPAHEDVSDCRIGQVLSLRVTHVKPDGKLDVTTREASYLQMDEDAEKVLGIIRSYAGVLPFTEKASPQVISRETGLSKNAFKRAIGRLYKKRLITLEGGKIRLVRE